MNHFHSLFQIALYVSILIICYIKIFFRRRNGFMQFVKYVLLPLTVTGGWIIYFIGYHLGSEEESTFQNIITHGLQAVFSAGRLFVLGNDLVEVPHRMKENNDYLLWFSVIGSTAVFISISILLNIFGKKIITRLKIELNQSKENHIFFGVNDASISLVKDLLKNDINRLVIIIKKTDKDEDATLYHQMEETGALIINSESIMESLKLEREEGIIHVNKEFSYPENLKKLQLIGKVLKNSSHLYFLSDKEVWNMSMARSVMNEIDTSSHQNCIFLHIRTNGADLDEVFYKSLPESSDNIQIRLFNQSDIAARQLVANYNPVDWIDKDIKKAVVTADFNVLIIGFDQTGNAVLRKLIEYGQFIGSQFKAVIIDRRLQSKKGRFENRFPGILSNYSIEFIETEVGSTAYFNLIKQYKNVLDYIIINLGDDALNIKTAVDIQQLLFKISDKKMKIIAQIKSNDSYKQLFGYSQFIDIDIFGRTMDIFTEDIIVRGNLEAMAKKIHEYYNSKKAVLKRKSWYELSKTEQATNISEAEHIYINLSLAGLKIEDIKKFDNTELFENYLGKEKMENLAKGEHLHWNSVMFTNGWDKWNLDEIPVNSKTNKDEIRKLHACMVNWDELSLVGERFGENYYQYDYETISDIFKLIKEGIYLNTKP